MKTLILGHGSKYSKEQIRVSPIDINEWFNDPYDSVDIDQKIDPSFIYDLRKLKWNFTDNEIYDRIIDTTGVVFHRGRSYSDCVLNNIIKLLKPTGVFYSLKFTIIKQNNMISKIER